MAARFDVYECEVCGHVVEVLREGKGTLVCCDQPMKLLEANTVDAAVEKHVPVVEEVEGGIKVKIGSVPHPMVPEHWIEWVQVIKDGSSYRRFLTPGDEPEAFFEIEPAGGLIAREHCNLHGLWKG
ncbi:MAG: desulfoferrodoxin [Actinobacteria bacterium]|nr:desulfoferrodoxin [Actinomycetota bacterium]